VISAVNSVSNTISGEGPYLGPTEYAIGVQEITAAVGTVDASIISLDATVTAGSAAIVAAVAANATAITTAVSVGFSELENRLRNITHAIDSSSSVVRWIPGTTINLRTRRGGPGLTASYVNTASGPPPILMTNFNYPTTGGIIQFRYNADDAEAFVPVRPNENVFVSIESGPFNNNFITVVL